MASKVKSVQSSKPQKTVRNVLVQPFKVQWPSIELAEATDLVNLLKQVPKDHVVHGTNAVNHLLGEGLACALLMSSDFHPQILGKQIIQMARRKSPEIKILALDSLSLNGKPEKLVAIRITSGQCPEKVTEMLNLIMNISKSKGYDVESSKCSPGTNKSPMKLRTDVKNISLEDKERLYLPRPTNGKRAFVPQISSFAAKQIADTKKDDWGQFVSFKRPRSEHMETNTKFGSMSKQESSSASTKANISESDVYLPLTVNRVQGNPNRKADKKERKKYYNHKTSKSN